MLHDKLVIDMSHVRDDLNLVLYVSAVTFLFPVNMFCKFVFTKLTNRIFYLTLTDYLDFVVFVLVAWLWYIVESYETTDLKAPLFSPEEDKIQEIKFIGNVLYDIVNDIFHVDFLMAAVTAVLWLRCIILLRLTETFGPLLIMIYRMAQLVASFLVIYVLGLLTVSSIATLTLHENKNFENLYEAMRSFMMASLGNFDIYQHDELEEEWKHYFGTMLHFAVIFSYMILMVNLLIAMMSDTYNNLTELRTGLFWGSVVLEMPKHIYDEHYGVLSIFPFVFSWISLLVLPALLFVKNKTTLKHINEVCYLMVYGPLSLCLLAVFMTVNMALLPFAYLKTVVYKALLVARYKSCSYCGNFCIYIVMGVPFLLCAQVTDVCRFMAHTYNTKQRQQDERTYQKTIRLSDFN